MHKTARSNSARTLVFAAGLAAVLTGAVAAQQRAGSDEDWCRDENRGRSRDNRQSVCEVRGTPSPRPGRR